jgi:hypothetical protein
VSLFELRGDLDADVLVVLGEQVEMMRLVWSLGTYMQTLNRFPISGVRSPFYRVEFKTVSSQASFFQEAGINFIFLVRDLGTCL